ncbi:MAG: sensor histidine kinase, partial [Limisphaerales bacterium]
FALWLSGAGLAVVVIGLAGGWFMAGRAIRPIEQISSTAQRIADGKLSERINVSESRNELDQLGAVLNNTFERLEHHFEQQVRFTADASHELRTPLAVMLTQIQLALSRERTVEEYQQTLRTCERTVERMNLLVNQLLDLARVDSGEFELILEDCELGRIAREALEFIQPLAHQKSAKLNTSLATIRTKVDAYRLGQVLINLLNNAIQHNPEGTELCLSVVRKGDLAFFRVADNGIGIPPEAIPHLFERFFRVDKARNRNKGNSGLGLAICKAIVDAHGGTISVESELGGGTTFQIEIPLR